MARRVDDSVLDAALNVIAGANIMTACSQEPATRAEAVTTYALADVAMAGPDYTIADGDVSGRKVTMSQKTGVLIDADGDANHVALCDGTTLLYVTTCTPQTLTNGNTMTFNSWKVEIADPT